MTPTLYAAFIDASQAEAAAVALLERGIRAQDISLVVNDSQREKRESGTEEASEGLNPAQDDYPRTESASTTELSSAPPDAVRMYNTGLETEQYNRGYTDTVEREIERDYDKARTRADITNEIEDADRGIERKQDIDHSVPPPEVDLDKAGVSKPTIPDVKTTVAASAGLGLGIGTLAALAAISLPGIGLVLGGGALATAVAGLAASSATGTSAEGIVGYLKDQGVPADDIPKLRAAYESGGAILAVALEKSPADKVELESILRSYGAEQVGSYGYAA